jgi:hypothetical protein
MEKLFKFKMVNYNKCERCGEVETYKHLLLEGREAKRVWKVFNGFLTNIKQQVERVKEYVNFIKIGNIGTID